MKGAGTGTNEEEQEWRRKGNRKDGKRNKAENQQGQADFTPIERGTGGGNGQQRVASSLLSSRYGRLGDSVANMSLNLSNT